MKKKKDQLFYYRLEPAQLLSALIQIPESERGRWITQFAIDLLSAKPTSELASSMVEEAKRYSEIKTEAIRKRWEEKQKKPDTGDIQTDTRVSLCNTSNSNSNSNNESLKTKVKRFVIPSVEEITAYCQERGNNVDPQKFFDHYQARDWKPKGYTRQMTDWKAAVRTWEPSKTQPAAETKPLPGTPEYKAALQKRLAY
jgi:hypothetical protein